MHSDRPVHEVAPVFEVLQIHSIMSRSFFTAVLQQSRSLTNNMDTDTVRLASSCLEMGAKRESLKALVIAYSRSPVRKKHVYAFGLRDDLLTSTSGASSLTRMQIHRTERANAAAKSMVTSDFPRHKQRTVCVCEETKHICTYVIVKHSWHNAHGSLTPNNECVCVCKLGALYHTKISMRVSLCLRNTTRLQPPNTLRVVYVWLGGRLSTKMCVCVNM